MENRFDDVAESYQKGKQSRRHSWSEADRAAAIARAQSRVFEHARQRQESRIQNVKKGPQKMYDRSDSLSCHSQAPSEDTLASGAVLLSDEWKGEVNIKFNQSEPFGLKLKLLMRRQPRAIIVSRVRSNSPAYTLIEPGDLLVAWTEFGGNICELFFSTSTNDQKLTRDFFTQLIDRLTCAPRPFNLIFRRRTEAPSALGRARAEIARITSTPPQSSFSPSCDLDKDSPIDGLSAKQKAKREVERISHLAKTPPRRNTANSLSNDEATADSAPPLPTMTSNIRPRKNSMHTWHQEIQQDDDDGSDILPPEHSLSISGSPTIHQTATF